MTNTSTQAAEIGMAWYNNCSEAERARWHAAAGSAVPADAYRAFCEQSTQADAPAAPAAVAPRIEQPYTLAEIRAKIASHDYSAELLLQHAMLLLEQIARSWDGCMYDAPGETIDIGADIRAAAAHLVAEQTADVAEPARDLHPEKCPITLRPFFMVLDHPELGPVPTYGGPFDSYTIPAPEGEPTDPWHERELHCERFDHDAGYWVEGGEPIPLRIVHDDVLFKLQSDAEAAAPAQAAPAAPDSAELRRLCQARDEARRERDLARAEIAGLQASTGHLSALVDGQHDLLEKAKTTMTALHDAASPIDESGGDLDARIPAWAFARFVDEHAALLHAMAQSPVAAPAAPAVDALALPAIKGAWIDGGYVIVTPASTGQAKTVKAAILVALPVAPDAARAAAKGE